MRNAILAIDLKALANEDTLLPMQKFPHLPACATFVADTRNVSDFVQKHFVSLTNASAWKHDIHCVLRVCAPKKHHEQ